MQTKGLGMKKSLCIALAFFLCCMVLSCKYNIITPPEDMSQAHTITYDLDGGVNAASNLSYYTPARLPMRLANPTKEGYLFFGWITEDNFLIRQIPAGTTDDLSLKALWYTEGQMYYLVKHNLQALEDETQFDFFQQEYCLGTVNQTSTATQKNITGFDVLPVQQQTISADGSTVVNVNYERKTYSVDFITRYDGNRKDLRKVTLSGKYQQPIVISDSLFQYPGYEFEYNIVSYEPHEPTYFGDEEEYDVHLNVCYWCALWSRTNGFKLSPIYRDFRGYNETGTGDGYITQELATQYGGNFVAGRGHPDFERINKSEAGIVESRLGSDGKPVFKQSLQTGITRESFDMWFRDFEGINRRYYAIGLIFNRVSDGIFQYSSNAYFPLDEYARPEYPDVTFGKGTPGYTDHVYSFTEEFGFYLQYDGSGSITISGDDDIWVFINGILAVDMGGCHTARSSQVSLTGVDRTQNINGREVTYKYNEAFDMVEGQWCSVRIFHAKRKAGYSNFSLTLDGIEVIEPFDPSWYDM